MKYVKKLEKEFYTAKDSTNYNIPVAFRTSKYSVELFLFVHIPTAEKLVLKHEHKAFELHYCLSGEGVLELENKKVPFTPHNFYFLPPGTVHTQIASSDASYSEFVLMFNVSPLKNPKSSKSKSSVLDDFDKIIDKMLKSEFFYGFDKNNVISILESITDLIKKNNETINLSLFCFMIMSALIQTMHNMTEIPFISREDLKNNDLPQKLSTSNISLSNDSQRIIYLDSAFRSIDPYITAESIADELFISIRQLNRICNKYYKMSFNQKWRQTRLEHATELLANFEEASLEEISHRLGFSSAKYFSKIFKDCYGMSPNKYRRQLGIYGN